MENGTAHKPHQISNFDNTRQHACSVPYSAQRRTRTGGAVAVHTGSTLVQHAQQKSGGAISSRPASASCIWAGVSGGVGPSGARQCMHDRHRDLGRDHQPEACWRSRLWSSLMMRNASSFSMLLIVLACDPDCMARRPRKWRRDTTLYAQCTVKSITRVGAPCCGGSRRKTGLPRE